MPWTVYILQCGDGTLYTGITTDLENRLAKHASGTGAKYTKGRAPYVVLHTEGHASKSDALRREAEIKSLTRKQKLELAGMRPVKEIIRSSAIQARILTTIQKNNRKTMR